MDTLGGVSGKDGGDLDRTVVNTKTGVRESPFYLDCPKGKLAVQRRLKAPESKGCSKRAEVNIPGEEDFTYCCDRHNVCYQV